MQGENKTSDKFKKQANNNQKNTFKNNPCNLAQKHFCFFCKK